MSTQHIRRGTKRFAKGGGQKHNGEEEKKTLGA